MVYGRVFVRTFLGSDGVFTRARDRHQRPPTAPLERHVAHGHLSESMQQGDLFSYKPRWLGGPNSSRTRRTRPQSREAGRQRCRTRGALVSIGGLGWAGASAGIVSKVVGGESGVSQDGGRYPSGCSLYRMGLFGYSLRLLAVLERGEQLDVVVCSVLMKNQAQNESGASREHGPFCSRLRPAGSERVGESPGSLPTMRSMIHALPIERQPSGRAEPFVLLRLRIRCPRSERAWYRTC